jgi:hypothetical protein
MLGRTARRWTTVVVLGLACLAVGASATADSQEASASRDASGGDRVILALALLEDSVIALKPQAPGVAWLDRVSSKPVFAAGALLLAGAAGGLAITWLVASVARGRPALEARRYSLTLRAPPRLFLS